MGDVDALQMVEHVRERLVDLAVSENYVRDNKIADVFRRVWSEGGSTDGLVSELWVEGTLPGEKAPDTLLSMAEQGAFPHDLCAHIAANGAFPVKARLFTHQVEALRTASRNDAQKPTLVITAGTGQGKTEAFLLPLLRDLWTAPQRRGKGMRALILYPLNALVADQVERIYRWLVRQNRLTVFHFTSETPEDARQANRQGEPEWEPCRMRTRQQARGRETRDGRAISTAPLGEVPDIVITNYSMLEYMLCRPQDGCFFGPDLRCIVLDEAHLYTGALAAEISMLLRRVRQRCGVTSGDVMQIATSATLGGTVQELKEFASVLFTADPVRTSVLSGKPGEPDLGSTESPPNRSSSAESLAQASHAELTTLAADGGLVDTAPAAEMDKLQAIVGALASSDAVAQARAAHPVTPARFLNHALRQSPLVRGLAEILLSGSGQVMSVDSLARMLFPDALLSTARAATACLLRLSAAARDSAGDMPLVPHRLHFLVRAPAGLSVCLNPVCSGPPAIKLERLGCVQSTVDRCRYCGHVTLPVHRCASCGEWAMAGHESQELPLLEPAYYTPSAAKQTFYLLSHPAELREEWLVAGKETVVDSETGQRRGYGARGTTLWKAPTLRARPGTQGCPVCLSEWTPRTDDESPYGRQPCGPLVGGRPFALSVVAETVLHDLPPVPDASRAWKPARGRRLLCFSDSRRAAARLGPLLTRQHEIGLVRAALARTARDHTSSEVVADINDELAQLRARLRELETTADIVRVDRLRREVSERQMELQRATAGIAFDQFARLFAERPEVKQLLDRDKGDLHRASFGQSDWDANTRAVQKHAEALVASELDRPIKDRVHVEATGLVEVAYPGIDELPLPVSFEAELPGEAVRARMRDCWPSLTHLLLDSLRFDQCVGWSDEDDGRRWMGKSPLAARWATRTRSGWGARAFVGATVRQQRRAFAVRVLHEAGCSLSDAERLSELALLAAFDQLYSTEELRSWLQRKEHHQVDADRVDRAVRIALDRVSVRRPKSLFRCAVTGTIWSRSALGWTWAKGCQGGLAPVSEAELNSDSRWGRPRRELLESPYFTEGLWGEEHSAQLDPHENRRLQDLFKRGVRNILSSTTTMELGVDIGGLNGVLLGNVPPGPANHRQRAGRAGRRSDGSAVVVTYARESEYDREVFRSFEKFLTRGLRRPTVFLTRSRIVQRHLQAVLLSEFLAPTLPGRTGTMEAYGTMGSFSGGVRPPIRWEQGAKPAWDPPAAGPADQFSSYLERIATSPQGMDGRLASLAEGTAFDQLVASDQWSVFVLSARDAFDSALRAWREELTQLKDAWMDIPSTPARERRAVEMAKAKAIAYQVRELCDITVIEWLASYRFLPRYGFPVNVQRLTVRSPDARAERQSAAVAERYKLERSALLALSEYVPGSEVLVGGRVARSRGVSKHWTDANRNRALGLDELAITCTQGHVFLSRSSDAKCPKCQSLPASYVRLLFPRFGYTTAAWESLERETSFERVGESVTYPTAFAEPDTAEEVRRNFGGITGLTVRYREGAQLLIRNAGKNSCGFALCTRCGYADSEEEPNQDGIARLPEDFKWHASIYSTDPDKRCWPANPNGQTLVLRNKVIAAREMTDMLLMEWPGASGSRRKGVFSLGRALVLAGTRLLELDHRELAMVPIPLVHPLLGIVIYDTSPGGCGHCAELLERGEEWIGATRDVLIVNEEHDRICNRACLDCILDFSGQHAAHMLNRKDALALFDSWTP